MLIFKKRRLLGVVYNYLYINAIFGLKIAKMEMYLELDYLLLPLIAMQFSVIN